MLNIQGMIKQVGLMVLPFEMIVIKPSLSEINARINYKNVENNQERIGGNNSLCFFIELTCVYIQEG